MIQNVHREPLLERGRFQNLMYIQLLSKVDCFYYAGFQLSKTVNFLFSMYVWHLVHHMQSINADRQLIGLITKQGFPWQITRFLCIQRFTISVKRQTVTAKLSTTGLPAKQPLIHCFSSAHCTFDFITSNIESRFAFFLPTRTLLSKGSYSFKSVLCAYSASFYSLRTVCSKLLQLLVRTKVTSAED